MALKKTLAAVLALGAIGAVAVPASAQDRYGRYDDDRYEDRYDDRRYSGRPVGPALNYNARIRNLEQRVDAVYRAGRLNEREASRVSRDVDAFARLVSDFSRGGWTRRENEIAGARYQELNHYLSNVARRPVYRSYDRRDDRRW